MSCSNRPSIGRLAADDREVRMAKTTYYVALAFMRSEGGDSHETA
jgi:hypothetical protein